MSESLQAQGDSAHKKRLGEILEGRYRIESVIGAGGQGVVYRAIDTVDGEHVAVKVLRDEVAADPQWRERMFREAQAMASLLGTSAVRVLDQGWTADRAHYLVMELLEGQDLETALTMVERSGKRAEPLQVLQILEPVADTLERAHAHGIVHRDVKPANVYLVRGGSVRLLDFGFAKFTRMRALTQAGYVAGSPSYIAPEVWLRGSDQIDHRVDVYSLGAVAFRALAGHPPFEGKAIVDVYRAATTAARPRLTQWRPEFSSKVDAWVDQALAIDRDARFTSVTALINALSTALGFPQSQRMGPRP